MLPERIPGRPTYMLFLLWGTFQGDWRLHVPSIGIYLPLRHVHSSYGVMLASTYNELYFTKIMDAETSPRTCLGLNHDLVFLFRLFYSSATMIRVFPYAGTQFMMFDSLKRWALQRKTRRDPNAEQRLSNMESLMSG